VAKRIFPPERVKPLRESLSWTQKDLAEYLDVSQPLVACWESGTMCPRGPVAILLSQLQARSDLPEKSLIPA
jgi:DNA-binding transcriptional regulator YiaG